VETTLYMAQSLNGVIARPDGSEDFLSARNWDEFVRHAERAGAFVVGRRTHEAVRAWPEKGFRDVEADELVVSTRGDLDPAGATRFGSPEAAVEAARDRGDDLVVTGGATLNAAFLRRGLVDRAAVNVEPHLLGEGVGLVAGDVERPLTLLGATEVGEGIVQLRYEIG